MAILKSVVNVNNGNTGWTKKDVIDALETAFANLGWHGGTQVSGVLQSCLSPGSLITVDPGEMYYNMGASNSTSWRRVGGTPVSQVSRKNRYFSVLANDTTSYVILERFYTTTNNSTGVNLADNAINVTRHELITGDIVVWAPNETNTSFNIGGLTLNTEYYVIADTANRFKLATSLQNATDGVAVDLTSLATTNGQYFIRKNSSDYNNFTLNVLRGDILNFYVDASVQGTFNLCGNVENYTENRKLNASAFSNVSYQDLPTGNGTATVVWDTAGWRQTETEPLIPQELQHPSYSGGLGLDGTIKYIYANDTHTSMKGEIVLLPCMNNDTYGHKNYFKYTVPASGNRSELKLRVWRQPPAWDSGYVVGITIHNVASGWSSSDTFTIPGTSIGGTSPANDITFGVNTNETASNLGNGVASLSLTNLGAGSNFYQKHDNGFYAILKNVNDPTKVYGTTYYTFATNNDNDIYLNINSGSGWHWLNRRGTSHTNTSASAVEPGYFTGQAGLDYQSSYNYISRSNDSNWGRIQFASTSTPTAYPLSIRIYKAQSPQDSNFAVIQFTQTINEAVVPYGTFTIHKGSSFGSSVFDLNYVYLDSYTRYDIGTRNIDTIYKACGYNSYSISQEPADTNNKIRGASYGWLRDVGADFDGSRTRYACNIDTNNTTSDTGYYSPSTEVVTYYRNSTYDRVSGLSVSQLANYYKPMKGLPIDNNFIPCPYYMPDDFAILQVSTTPGLTQFRPGDTITISQSEVYEIIIAGYQTQQNGLDNINNNSSIGMIFMARIV